MLSSFLFHELSMKGGSVESGGEGILAPDNMNEYSMEEEEDDSFQVRYKYNVYAYCGIVAGYVSCIYNSKHVLWTFFSLN